MNDLIRDNVRLFHFGQKLRIKLASFIGNQAVKSIYKQILCILLLLFISSFINTIYAEKIPRKIISLGPSLTEQLFILEAGNLIIGNTTYCTRPPQASEITRVGNIKHFDIEKVLSLDPDLVLSIGLSDPKQMKKIRDMNIQAVNFPYAKSFDEICDQFVQLGELIGKKKKAEEIILNIRNEVDMIRNRKRSKKTSVFFQIGIKPLFTIIKDSFLHDYVVFAGGKNISEDAVTGLFSREQVIGYNPDIIIIATMGIIGEAEKKSWQKYKSLKAVENNDIHIIDPEKSCSPTPVTFLETLKLIEKIINSTGEDK